MDVAQKRHRSRPWTFVDVSALFASRGCILLEEHYAGYQQVMRYSCPAGHEYAQRFDHFVQGHGCPQCRNARRWDGRRIDLDDVLLMVEDEGLADVEVARAGGKIRISYTCELGHRSSTTRAHFLAGKRCRRCATRGAKSPHYNPDLTDEDRNRKRRYDDYAIWRSAVFERDGYACRRCGARGRLNAHHIVNYSSAKELRTALGNGITLCLGCHRGFHRQFGVRNNNAEQLVSFMGMPWV